MKIAIIGAGICGLYLAWKLAERGEEVTVFEKREKIGKEACSGLLSERILEFIPQSRELIQNKIDFVLVHLSSFREDESADEDESKLRRRKFHRPPKRTLKINFSKKFFVVNHSELDRLVAKLAEDAGAKIILGKPVDSLPEDFDRIIGCDGANSTVRKSLGLREPNYRLAIQGFISKQNYSNFVETWPVEGFTLQPFSSKGAGFIWKIPRGRETEYGIIASLHDAKNIFEDFLAKNRISLERTITAMVPQGFIMPKGSPDITLCGDAAGLTKPWSGGGVIWGLMAAGLLLKNFPDFLKYQKEVKRFFLPKIIFSKIAAKMVYFFGFNIPWLIPKNVRIEGDFLM